MAKWPEDFEAICGQQDNAMTTPTTSRVSDAMLAAACDAFVESPGAFDKLAYPIRVSIRRDMRVALEAALASQGDVVAVSELKTLKTYFAYWDGDGAVHETDTPDEDLECGDQNIERVVIRYSDLLDILNKGEK